jgi:hypothetical protein
MAIFVGPTLAQRPRMGGYVNHAFKEIYAANAGHSVSVDEINEVNGDEIVKPSPYRLEIAFLSEQSLLRVVVFKDDREISRHTLKPAVGGNFNQRWVTYLWEADGLYWKLGINGSGSMPVNVTRTRNEAASLLFGRVRLAGVGQGCRGISP